MKILSMPQFLNHQKVKRDYFRTSLESNPGPCPRELIQARLHPTVQCLVLFKKKIADSVREIQEPTSFTEESIQHSSSGDHNPQRSYRWHQVDHIRRRQTHSKNSLFCERRWDVPALSIFFHSSKQNTIKTLFIFYLSSSEHRTANEVQHLRTWCDTEKSRVPHILPTDNTRNTVCWHEPYQPGWGKTSGTHPQQRSRLTGKKILESKEDNIIKKLRHYITQRHVSWVARCQDLGSFLFL